MLINNNIEESLEELEKEIPDEYQISKEFKVRTESLWHLQQDVTHYSEIQHRWSRLYNIATSIVRELTLQFNQLSAKIVEERIFDYEQEKGKSFPVSARSEVRKTVYSDERLVKKQRELDQVMNIRDYLERLLHDWIAKGFRLGEVVNMMVKKNYDSDMTIDGDMKAIYEKSQNE